METTHIVSLRSLSEQKGIYMGAAANHRALRTDYAYRELLAQEFNMLTTENELKIVSLSPRLDAYDFGSAEELIDFAQANNMLVRGHTLVWHKMNPAWLKETSFTRRQSLDLLHKHIFTVMAHFYEEIYAWDVVNEPLYDHGGLRDSFWLHTIGPDYIENAFKWAHQADPHARLFMNEYAVEGINTKSNDFYELAKDLVTGAYRSTGSGFKCISLLRIQPHFQHPLPNRNLRKTSSAFLLWVSRSISQRWMFKSKACLEVWKKS